jgi:hypothetical protein
MGLGRIKIALDRPGVDDLAALLDDRPEIERRRVGVDLGAGLLRELTSRDGRHGFAGAIGLTLRDRPVAGVAVHEVGPAGMGEEHLDPAAAEPAAAAELAAPGPAEPVGPAGPPVEQDPRTRPFTHRGPDGRAGTVYPGRAASARSFAR